MSRIAALSSIQALLTLATSLPARPHAPTPFAPDPPPDPDRLRPAPFKSTADRVCACGRIISRNKAQCRACAEGSRNG